ncbi:hypothetical protein LXL04_019909 [Taraxacum kok-saghyz]
MPSGPKKRRAARRKRRSGTNPTEEELLEDALELSESLNTVLETSNDDGVKKGDDQISLESPLTAHQSEHVEKSKHVDPVMELESVITKEKECTESESQKETKGNEYVELVGESAFHGHGPTKMVNCVTLDVNNDKVDVNMCKEDVVQYQPQLIMVDTHSPKEQPLKSSCVVDVSPDPDPEPGHEGEYVEVGKSASTVMVNDIMSVMNEGEEMSMEGAGESSLEEPTEPQALDNIRTKDPSLSVEPAIKADVHKISLKDDQDSLGSSSLQVDVSLVEDHGPPEMVNHDATMVNEGGEMSMEVVVHQDFSVETSSHEPQEMVQSVLNKEAEVEEFESIIEVDVETMSFEDAPDAFETPLGSPSLGYMSPVEGDVPFKGNYTNEIHDPQKIFDHLKQVQQHSLPATSIKECVQVGENTLRDPPATFNHVESIINEDGEMSFKDVSQTLMVKEVDELVLEKEAEEPSIQDKSVIEMNIDTSFKNAHDSSKEPSETTSMVTLSSGQGNKSGKVGVTTCDDSPAMVDHVGLIMNENEKEIPMEGVVKEPFVQGNTCVVGECACDAPLVNFVMSTSVGDEMTINSSHGPQEMVDIIGQEHGGDTIYPKDIDTGDIVCIGSPMVVLKEDEEMPMKGVVEEPSGGLLDDQQEIDNTTDQSEENVKTSSNDAQEYSLKAVVGSSFWVNVSPIEGSPFVLGIEEEDDDDTSKTEGLVEEDPTEPSSLHEQQEMVKAFDHSVLNEMPLAESVAEMNIETTLEDALKDSLGNPCLHKVTFIPGNVHGDEAIEGSAHGGRVMVVLKMIPLREAQDLGESVIEATSLKDTERDVQGKRCDEVGRIACDDVSVLEDEEMSMEFFLEEPFHELTQLSSDGVQAMVKIVDFSVQDPCAPAESASIETSPKDSLLENTFLVDMPHRKERIKGDESATMVNPVGSIIKTEISTQGVVEDHTEDVISHSLYEPDVLIKTDDEFVMEGIALKDPSLPVEPLERQSMDHVLMSPLEGGVQGNVFDNVGESEYHVVSGEGMSLQVVLQDLLEDPTEISSKEMINRNDELTHAQDPSMPVDSVIKVNVDTSLEDAQDSFETPLGSPSVGHVNPLEDFAQWNDKFGDSSRVMVKTVDQVIPLEETQEPSLSVEAVIELNEEIPLKKDAKDQSSMGSLEGFSIGEVGEMSFHGEVEAVFEEPVVEKIEPSSDELHTMVKDNQDFEANVETSSKDNQDSLKEPLVSPFMVCGSPVEEKTCGEGGENTIMVNHVELGSKENEYLSSEGFVGESVKEPNEIGRSTHEQQTTVNTIDMPLRREIPLNEAADLTVPVESFSEANLETSSFNDAQASIQQGTSSSVDVYHAEGIGHGSPVMADHGSSTLVNGSRGQRNEMVGLVRSLLEEIRRIRAFYEEGLRQTTQIDLQMLQVLENFDSGPQL